MCVILFLTRRRSSLSNLLSDISLSYPAVYSNCTGNNLLDFGDYLNPGSDPEFFLNYMLELRCLTHSHVPDMINVNNNSC